MDTVGTHTHTITILLYPSVCMLTHPASQGHIQRAWHDMTNHQNCGARPFGKRATSEKESGGVSFQPLNEMLGQRKGPVCINLWPHNGQIFRGIHFSESNAITIMGRGF